MKLSLSEKDTDHLYKLRDALNSNHPIHTYKVGSTAFSSKHKEARLVFNNKYFGTLLYEQYGLIPNRYDANKLISHIPKGLERHFIRGVLDADGSLSSYYIQESNLSKPSYKCAVRFYTYESLLVYIRNHFIDIGLSSFKQNFRKRHEDRDGVAKELQYTGNKQVPKILNYLYKDSSVYLERKYRRALEIMKIIKC